MLVIHYNHLFFAEIQVDRFAIVFSDFRPVAAFGLVWTDVFLTHDTIQRLHAACWFLCHIKDLTRQLTHVKLVKED